MASITIDNVIKDYGTTRVLHGLNLDIREPTVALDAPRWP